MSFVTVEDVNTCFQKNINTNLLHTIDTSVIGTHEFEDVKYDFCILSHTVSGSNHTFNFQIINSNWYGRYYVLNSNNEFVNVTGTYDSTTQTLSITTTNDSIKLVLYCTGIGVDNQFSLKQLKWVFNDFKTVKSGLEAPVVKLYYTKLSGNITSFTGSYKPKNSDEWESLTITKGSDSDGDYLEFTLTDGLIVNIIGYNSSTYMGDYLLGVDVIKESPELRFTTQPVSGKVNTVYFEADSVYDGLIYGTVTYKGTSTPIESDATGYYFELDLTSKRDDKPVLITVNISENDRVDNTIINYTLNCNYPVVSTESELLLELMQNTQIIQLGNDITLTNNINITNPVLIYGENHILDCDTYQFIINNDFTINNTIFDNGKTIFLQKKNTKLVLNNCRFNNATADSNSYTASVVHCDIDVASLTEPRDYTTNINGCLFVNCENTTIYHGGLLTINNTRYLNNLTAENIYTNYPSFLYQIDGDALIQNSIFDIDTEDTCQLELDLKYVPALWMCGETATVNNMDYIELKNPETINFFNTPYNNQSHILCDYLYDEISECIYLSPTGDKEDKAVCYSLSGEDYLYKKNVQITRKSWGTENHVKKIIWEDI